MIILDTNVVSEMMEATRDDQVELWLNRTDPLSLWLTAILVFEIKGGLDLMHDGRRKRRLLAGFETLLDIEFRDRVFPFDGAAALEAARIGVERRRKGRPIDIKDTLIGGIAVSRGASIATRNVRHFQGLPVQIINPWNVPA